MQPGAASRPTSGPGSTDNRNREIQTGASVGFVLGAMLGVAIVGLIASEGGEIDPKSGLEIVGISAAIGTGLGTAIAVFQDNADDRSRDNSNSTGSSQDSSGGLGPGDNGNNRGGDSSGADRGSADNEGEDGSGCFIAGTPVMLADGSQRAIETVAVGTLLLAQDPDTGAVAAQPATTLFTHNVRSTLRLRLSDGTTLDTTAQHRFYVPGSGFVAAGGLLPGSAVITHRGERLTVLESAAIAGQAIVYNLEVANVHTYFAGSSAIWVHNKKPDSGGYSPPDSGGD